jgi:hypothetical protein
MTTQSGCALCGCSRETHPNEECDRFRNPPEDSQMLATWVYCKQHVRPHTTGWCTVGVRDKVALAAKNRESAYAEARALGYAIHGEGDD